MDPAVNNETVPVGPVQFRLNYRNSAFAQFELGFRLLFLMLSVAVLIVYWLASGNVADLSESRLQDVVWMRVLLAGLVLFNNPVFMFTFIAPHVFLTWLGTMFQITFLSMLLLYWLVEFSVLSTPQVFNKRSMRAFYLPKTLYIAAYFIVCVALYSVVVFKRTQDQLYAW